jgi:hypothetical protein
MRVGVWVPSPDGETCGTDCVWGIGVGVDDTPPDGSRTGTGCAGLIAPDKADNEATDNMADIIHEKN